jgi:hypothetical protein
MVDIHRIATVLDRRAATKDWLQTAWPWTYNSRIVECLTYGGHLIELVLLTGEIRSYNNCVAHLVDTEVSFPGVEVTIFYRLPLSKSTILEVCEFEDDSLWSVLTDSYLLQENERLKRKGTDLLPAGARHVYLLERLAGDSLNLWLRSKHRVRQA